MSEAPISPGQPNRNVECPECGQAFAPRGIAAHRRMRHGITPDAAVELAGTLTRIASVLERLDARLAAERTAQETETAAGDSGEDGRTGLSERRAMSAAGQLLEQGLRDVMAEIARVKRSTEQQISHVAGRPLTDEQKLLEKTAFHALASLRRRQADLIYRMQSETGANGSGLDALASI